MTPGIARALELRGNTAFVADDVGGLRIMDPIRLGLLPDLTQAPASSVQTYTVSWPARAVGPRVRCLPTGGTCTVTGVDLANRRATISWTLPATSGAHSLSVAVGNWNYFTTARDDVQVP